MAKAAAAVYQGEPFVVAADVCASPDRAGRSGWTCYTGSAARMYRIWVEEVLGIIVRNGVLSVNPVCPADWGGFHFTYRFGTVRYDVTVHLEEDAHTARIEGDFIAAGNAILLVGRRPDSLNRPCHGEARGGRIRAGGKRNSRSDR